MSETETIARNLSGELARHRKTQAALAKELGVSEQNISKRLQGEGSFTTEQLEKAAGMLESFELCGMKGLKAESFTLIAASGSERSSEASGNSPVNLQLLKCGKPCIEVFVSPVPKSSPV